LFITTCIEKQCTGPLMLNVKQERREYQFFNLWSNSTLESNPKAYQPRGGRSNH